jgi:hypothetical protein
MRATWAALRTGPPRILKGWRTQAMPEVMRTAPRPMVQACTTRAITAAIITVRRRAEARSRTPDTTGRRPNHYGAYYHQPATVGYYGAGCYGCGAAGWGAAAAVAGTAAVVGTAAAIGTAAAVSANSAAAASANSAAAYNAGVAAGSASTAAAYSAGAGAAAAATFAALPDGCAFKPSGTTAYYFCAGSGLWLMPAYGANGLYYRAVAAP